MTIIFFRRSTSNSRRWFFVCATFLKLTHFFSITDNEDRSRRSNQVTEFLLMLKHLRRIFSPVFFPDRNAVTILPTKPKIRSGFPSAASRVLISKSETTCSQTRLHSFAATFKPTQHSKTL
ncbi:MAG: hypothetical protein GX799_06920 [Crenarchaeota archaeon]|nr:hypothetical protein [Thermoproteota archaeon]